MSEKRRNQPRFARYKRRTDALEHTIGRLEARYRRGKRAWHLISDRELEQMRQEAFENGAELMRAVYTIRLADLALWQSLNQISSACICTDLLPASQRVSTLRALLSSPDQIGQADKLLGDGANQLEALLKKYEPYIKRYASRGAVDYQNIKFHLETALAVRDGVQALLRDKDPDDGTQLRQAIATYSPLSDQANQIRVEDLRSLHPKIGAPADEVVSSAKKMLKKAMTAYGLKKGSRGYREKVRKGALMQFFRDCNVNDPADFQGVDGEVYRYLKSIDDTMISKLLREP